MNQVRGLARSHLRGKSVERRVPRKQHCSVSGRESGRWRYQIDVRPIGLAAFPCQPVRERIACPTDVIHRPPRRMPRKDRRGGLPNGAGVNAHPDFPQSAVGIAIDRRLDRGTAGWRSRTAFELCVFERRIVCQLDGSGKQCGRVELLGAHSSSSPLMRALRSSMIWTMARDPASTSWYVRASAIHSGRPFAPQIVS